MAASDVHPTDRFVEVFEAAGGTTRRVTSPGAAAAAIAKSTAAQGVREVLYEPDALIEKIGLRLLLAAHGIDLRKVEGSGDRAPHMRVSLTGAELAIAETGTLLVGGSPGGWGLATVLPWVHIVLLPATAIVPSLAEAFGLFEERLRGGEGDWVWITGPSRTADIGHTLVLGAHGPNALDVVVLG